MELSAINRLIDELEEQEVSLSNIRNLSALYTVRNHFVGGKIYNNVVQELDDILPSYLKYLDVKRKFQQKEVQQESVLLCFSNLCQEICEFLHRLYSSTDLQQERDLLHTLIEQLKAL